MSTPDFGELGAFAGGAIGALLRAWLGEHLAASASRWSWPTFLANITGSFARVGYALASIVTRLAAIFLATTIVRRARVLI